MRKGWVVGQFHQPVLYVSLCALIDRQHGVIRALKYGATILHHPLALGGVLWLQDLGVNASDGA